MSSRTSICELYRSYCEEEFCRPNSAVLHYIEERGEMYPLEMLMLESNYLGPRGLRPIVRLVAYCQTMVHLNLDGNGADNETVEQLCAVLENHLCMQTVSLRNNPITTSGGKSLLSLVERNPRILAVDLTNTDVFNALISRIQAVTEANQKKAASETPQMYPLRTDEEEQQQQQPQKMTGSCIAYTGARLPLKKPSLTLLPALAKETAMTTTTAEAATALSASATAFNGRKTLPRRENSVRESKDIQPFAKQTSRPSAPAIASRESRRMPELQLKELQRRYREKALLLQEINSSQAGKAADRAREELMLLEKNVRIPFHRSARSGVRKPHTIALHEVSTDYVDTNRVPQRGQECEVGGDEDNQRKRKNSTLDAAATDAPDLEETPHGRREVHRSNASVNDDDHHHHHDHDDGGDNGAIVAAIVDANPPIEDLTEIHGAASHSAATVTSAPAPAPAPPAPAAAAAAAAGTGGGGGGGGGGCADATEEVALATDDADGFCVEELRESPVWMTLDSGEQIKRLFDSGCRAYVGHQFDAAYMAWNEAVNIAVGKKNREWMTVLSSNLQRLSYEMLVRDGIEQLNLDRLEEADVAFQRALEVAHKAHNAQWQTDMHKARRDVQQAVFRRHHDSALKLFARAKHLQDQTITEDDYFVVPGTDVIVQHTQAYVNEWPRMLLVKEAVETWAASRKIIAGVGGSAGRVLTGVVRDSLDEVTHFLVERYFDSEDPQSLSWMSTSKYNYTECIMLCTLWTDMSSSSDFVKHHKPFAAIAAAQIGNYHLATNQLVHAQTQFDTLMMLADELEDPVLRAAGRTFSALLNWQRGRYAVVEELLREAVLDWGALREDAYRERERQWQQSGNSNSNGSGKNGANESGSADDASAISRIRCSRILPYVPRDYVAVMESASFKYLVSSIASTYRYAEALEMLERSLVCKHRDLLFEKLRVNFTTQPTLDHIVATSSQIHSCLLYQFMTHHYDWSTEERRYMVDEKLLMWVVPRGKEMRFVEIGVTKDFKVSSINKLIESVRRGLLLDPISSNNNLMGEVNGIIMTPPKWDWVEPLQTLYAIIIEPVVEFLRASDPLLLGTNGVVTVIPTDRLWLVPFNALIARNGNFVVEDFALQLAFCATQCAFAALNAERVRERDLYRNVVFVQREVDMPAPHLHPHVTFPFDALRSVNEGECIRRTLAQHKRVVRRLGNADTGITMRGSEVLIDDLEAMRGLLPKSRMMHIATSTTSGLRNDEGSAGAICVAVSQDEASLLRASEIERMELFAELVVMTNANMSSTRVAGTHDDVHGLVRGFLSSGVPCVIVAQWCTPDMVPAELFSNFYALLSPKNMQPRTSASPEELDVSNPTAMMSTAGAGETAAQPTNLDDKDNLDVYEAAHPCLHKALVLALATRALLEDDFFRYSPRAWAGYYCVGYGALQYA